MSEDANSFNHMDLQSRRMLLADWVSRLLCEAGEAVTHWGTSGDGTFTLVVRGAFEAVGRPIEDPPYLKFTATASEYQAVLDHAVLKATEALVHSDFGGHVWHTMELQQSDIGIPMILSGAFMQRLGLQQRITGGDVSGRGFCLNSKSLPSRNRKISCSRRKQPSTCTLECRHLVLGISLQWSPRILAKLPRESVALRLGAV